MHVTERERLILEMMAGQGFVTCRALGAAINASGATIWRDLNRLEEAGQITRVRGGATRKRAAGGAAPASGMGRLLRAPLRDVSSRPSWQEAAIGRAAAKLCQADEGVMMEGDRTVLQMCPHLAGLNLQVLTNSLHIAGALLPQMGTRVLLPSGAVLPGQNVILSPEGEDSMPRFHAPKLFMGATSIGCVGIMQADVLLAAAARRLTERAEQRIVLAESSKFRSSSGNVICSLGEIGILITDRGISDADAEIVESAGVRLIIA